MKRRSHVQPLVQLDVHELSCALLALVRRVWRMCCLELRGMARRVPVEDARMIGCRQDVIESRDHQSKIH